MKFMFENLWKILLSLIFFWYVVYNVLWSSMELFFYFSGRFSECMNIGFGVSWSNLYTNIGFGAISAAVWINCYTPES